MNRIILFLLLSPALILAAEGDIPIQQSDGSLRTKTVTGHASIDADGVVSIPLGRLSVTVTGDLATGDIDITGGDDAVIITARLTGDAVTLDVTPPAAGGYAVLLVLDSDDGTHTLAIAQQTVPIYTPLGSLTGITPPAGSPTLYQITALTTGIWLTPVPTAIALAAAP